MFKEARIKLTAWYLVIIMAISLSFSAVIYVGINRELTRIEGRALPLVEEFRRDREARGLPTPRFEFQPIDPDTIPEARIRILTILGLINLSILGISGVAGYFLAGRTLEPIALMLDEQKEFVSNASHELRTPLTSLKSEIEVALRDKKMTFKDAKELLKSNLEEVDKMHKLSDYLLRLNKYQSGVAALPLSQVNLKNIAERAFQKVQALAKMKRIKIIKKLQNVGVKGNEDSLVELATILLENAVKYSYQGKEVILRTKKEGDSGILEVEDFGVGIKKENIPHVFERFFRADISRNKQKTDGYGLGLAIAKSIVEMHSGQISAESQVGKRTIFSASFKV